MTLAIRQGMGPRPLAVLIGQVVGLHSKQAKALALYVASLAATPKLTQQQQEARAAKLAARLRRQRALTIARTETMRAANMGQQLLWKQAQAQGLIDPTRVVREWIVTRDDRTCPICRPMDGKRVGLDQPWRTLDGKTTTLTPLFWQRMADAAGLLKLEEKRAHAEARAKTLRR